MTTFLNSDATAFDAQLDAARRAANCAHYAALFDPKGADLDSEDLEMIAMDRPGSPKDAADALFECLRKHLAGNDVALIALTALHTVHHEDRYESGCETAFDMGMRNAH